MSRSTILRLALVCTLLGAVLLAAQAATAQHVEPDCDIEEVIHHQAEHAEELAHFPEEAETDLDAALAKLYRTAIAYQALAIECGFANEVEVEATHEAEHAGEDAHGHSEDEETDVLAVANSIGDPENGKVLFNTFRTEVSFACATCHRVDSTEMLVGPGLLGVSAAAHDHSVHSDEATPAATDGMSGMNMGEATAEATVAAERTIEEAIEYIHTSIIDPSAFVVPNFPDNLMPKVYGTIYTEQEINDLVAYLITLR